MDAIKIDTKENNHKIPDGEVAETMGALWIMNTELPYKEQTRNGIEYIS